MKIVRCFSVVLAMGILLSAAIIDAGDWPCYRGPNKNGICSEGIEQWPPVELWRASVGQGYSQVTVSDGRVYTAGWASNQDTVYCFDEASTGTNPTPLWTQSYSCGSISYQGTRATPTVDGNEVYMFSHTGRLSVFNKATGTPLWDVTASSGTSGWGLASSPLIDNMNNLVILNVGNSGVAIDKGGTHSRIWPATVSGTAGYASAVPFTWSSQNLVAIFTGSKVSVINPATGSEVCYYSWSATANAADPIISGDYMFISTGYSFNCVRVKLGAGQLTIDESDEWSNTSLQNKENCSVLSNGYLYGIDDGGTLRCLNWATGATMWSHSGFGTEGAVMIANGELVVVSGSDGSTTIDGDLVVVQLTETGYNELHRQTDILTGDTWTAPVIANGKLYLRSHEGTLICFDVSAAGPSHTITASADSGGSITPSGSVSVTDGGNQTFSITPNTGYHIATVLVDGSNDATAVSTGTYTFSNVTVGHTIQATFGINTYTITASAGANGSISPSGAVSVNYGANRTFTITPNTGYHIATVLVDGVNNPTAVSSGTYTFNSVTANGHTISATFAVNTYNITASAGANGSISPSGTVSVNYGSNQTFTITPNSGYQIATVLVDSVNNSTAVSSGTHTFNSVAATHTISATFSQITYALSGSITTTGDASNVNGATLRLMSGPTEIASCVVTAGNYTLNAPAGTYTYSLTMTGYALTVTSPASVTVSGITSQNLTVNAVTMTTWTITATAGANGSLSPVGSVIVTNGANQTFTITPNSGYDVADVLVDGVSIGATSSYVFVNVLSNRTISATFSVSVIPTDKSVTTTAGCAASGRINASPILLLIGVILAARLALFRRRVSAIRA